jgi:hypothetical protein
MWVKEEVYWGLSNSEWGAKYLRYMDWKKIPFSKAENSIQQIC